MTEQTRRGACDRGQQTSVERRAEGTSIEAGWRRFRDELDARILARFGVAFDPRDGDHADPDILADLALQRALMP